MIDKSDWGHLGVALFVFIVGVTLYACVPRAADLGKEIVVGALTALWTIVRLKDTK